MPVAISNDVKISVETSYQNDKVSNTDGHHMFAYRITIENRGEYTIQLMSRHWDIIDSLNGFSEVEGDGVIGQQPILEPGEKYTYVSGCALLGEFGKMYGFYTMKRQMDGKEFEVTIPEFIMIAPFKFN